MPNYSGDLTEKDTLRLLAALRYARRFVNEDTAHTVAAEYVVSGVRVQVTFGQFLDAVLQEYCGYDTETG